MYLNKQTRLKLILQTDINKTDLDNISTSASVGDNEYQEGVITPKLDMSDFKLHASFDNNVVDNNNNVGNDNDNELPVPEVRRSQRIKNQKKNAK
jgi:hypothetical protein